jgi:murein L,D-transpeptidase YcbB/YkuD
VAAFTLEAVDGDTIRLRMRVVVGRPYRPTPEFSDRIRYLVLNPYWEVPPSLAAKDKLPLIRRDPGYLAREHIRVLRGWGERAQEIDPAGIDWWRVATPLPYRLRQDPGPWNALGRIKFMFPNEHAVYLHDTPSKALFERNRRDFSHGCVRVQDPIRFAESLLAEDPNLTARRIERSIGGREMRFDLKTPVPVHLAYFTAVADAGGRIELRPDIYGLDHRMIQALSLRP